MKFSVQKIVLLLVFICLGITLFSFPHSAFAQNYQATNNEYLNPNNAPDVPKNLHTYSQNVLIDTLSAVACLLTGTDPLAPRDGCIGVNTKTGQFSLIKSDHGAIGMMGNMISQLYNPPVHTRDYFADLFNHFGPTSHAYAQDYGSGFDHLSPILPIWAGFRNVVYLLFIIAFVIIGLAIMLRLKIDPRTVMSIQNQIPRIIIGLILVTFSLAIAGFLIDLMYVFIFLIIEIIRSIDPNVVGTGLDTNFQSSNPLGYANQLSIKGTFGFGDVQGILGIITNISGQFFSIIHDLLDKSEIGQFLGNFLLPAGGAAIGAVAGGGVFSVPGMLIGGLMGSLINHLFPSQVGGVINGIVSGIATMIAFLIIAIAVLSALIRTWFALLMAYVSILLDIVLAPFWIVLSIMPGGKVGFSGWIKSLVANLAVFPAIIGMFLLAEVFMDKFNSYSPEQLFVPPLIGNLNGGSIGAFIGLGFILMTPKAVELIKTAIKAPSNPAGAGALSGLNAGIAPVTGILGGGVSRLFSVNSHGEATGPISKAALRLTRNMPKLNAIARYATKAQSIMPNRP